MVCITFEIVSKDDLDHWLIGISDNYACEIIPTLFTFLIFSIASLKYVSLTAFEVSKKKSLQA